MDPYGILCSESAFIEPLARLDLAARRRGEDREDTVLPGLKGPPASHDLDCQKSCRKGKAGTGPRFPPDRPGRRRAAGQSPNRVFPRRHGRPLSYEKSTTLSTGAGRFLGAGPFHPRPAARERPARRLAFLGVTQVSNGLPGWATGIEPATSGTTIRRSDRLSYAHQGTPRTPGHPWPGFQASGPRKSAGGVVFRLAGHARGTKGTPIRSDRKPGLRAA